MSILKDLRRLYLNKVFTPPDWLFPNLQFLALTGSESYGCSTNSSDVDITGIVIPPKQYIVPQEYGYIYGFDTFPEFNSYQKHHILDIDKKKEYDLTVFNIVNAFKLMASCNPNAVDILFVPRRCILYTTEIWENVIQNRKIFLSQEAVTKYRAYSFSQMKKLDRIPIGKRKDLFDTHSYDLKFAYNTVRLNLSAEQILQGDLDIERDREVFKSIRRGEWTLEQIKEWFFSQSKKLDSLQEKCTLPLKTDKEKIKTLLKKCLNVQYQNMLQVDHSETIRKLKELVLEL